MKIETILKIAFWLSIAFLFILPCLIQRRKAKKFNQEWMSITGQINACKNKQEWAYCYKNCIAFNVKYSGEQYEDVVKNIQALMIAKQKEIYI